ncbi:DUF4129 domain-containing protein [Lysobacter fragariae]
MRIEDLTVALRPRSAWEAGELGSALVRRHAAAVWAPWLALTLPLFALANLLCWSIDTTWLAGLLMWWLKPAFDRVPLYVLSRAVFGHVPPLRETLRAQLSWGLRWLPAYLLWRRLGPLRSVYLPVDFLEGGRGEAARARRRAIGAPMYGVGSLQTVVFANFELAICLGLVVGVMLFVPNEFARETAARLWNVMESQPTWLQLCINAVMWTATSLVEPFYIGAGFGLYLNRRTQIEAWDIEIVFRRLRARLTQAASPLLLALCVGLCAVGMGWPRTAAAQDEPPPHEMRQCGRTDTAATESPGGDNATLRSVFGVDASVHEDWRQSVKRAYDDPRVTPHRTVSRWVPRNPQERAERKGDFSGLGQLFALIGEYGLWVVVGVLLLALALTSPRWVAWLRDATAREQRERGEVSRETVLADDAPLPEDIPAAARRLWRAGRERDALALLYRASVDAMVRRANVVLVPGATEAHTLRASRQMPSAEDRDAFARAVRTWQIAAYAHGLPAAEEFDELLGVLARRFGWQGAGATP